ncbi:MAG: DNA-3-methyladenine glycosylase [Myxococcales bacterium]
MARLRPLPRAFYDRNAAWVAPALIGCLLVRKAGRGRVRIARIVETEAYVGEEDLACHARVGRTARTEVMYGRPGRAYVYLVYGLHHCLNAVCGPGAAANAVLIRAAEPVAPDEAPAQLALSPLLHSATGPGNLCKALGLTLAHNREDLCAADGSLFIAPRPGTPPPHLWAGPRIGVDYAGGWADEPLRFCDADSAFVSRPLPPRPARSRR